MTWLSPLAVGIGGFFGALLRWGLGLALNPIFPTVPLGTLAANLLGGFLIGLLIALFTQYQVLPPEVRLFAVTGLLGGLTTFSTFSAETVALLMRQQYAWVLGIVSLHVAGSIAMTLLGFALVQWLLARGGA